MRVSSSKRLLLVHAHPDDETINNGVTMAKYANEGVQVTLVTCTRGEEGEVLVSELSNLASDKDDKLGAHREIELKDAMAHLGIKDFRFLGAPGKKWRDSGMMGTPQNDRTDVFWQSDLDESATELVKVILEIKPQVLITYDEIIQVEAWTKSEGKRKEIEATCNSIKKQLEKAIKEIKKDFEV